MKDVVCWAAADFNQVVAMMKLDLHEPPMSQVRHRINGFHNFCKLK